ncbi:hypothetical protein BH20ACT5_BH20ACT5_21410 [soil metagenome]
MNPGRGRLRLLRGAVLAACCVLLAISGHALGDGPVGLTAPLVVAIALVAGGSVAWADQQRGFGHLLGAAMCSQVAFHLTLSLSPEHAVGHAGATVDVRMVLGHVAATVVMAWILAKGDAGAWALHRSLRGLLPRIGGLPTVPASPPSMCPRRRASVENRAGLRLATARPHRGPPAWAVPVLP